MTARLVLVADRHRPRLMVVREGEFEAEPVAEFLDIDLARRAAFTLARDAAFIDRASEEAPF